MLVVIAIITLLAAFLLPALSRAKEKARCAKCISNLRQVSLAFRTFAMDQAGHYPWHVLPSEGGTFGPDAGQAWKNCLVVSNEMSTPRILSCPSDRTTKANVWDWSEQPGGLAHTGNRGKALSYFVGLDSYEELAVTLVAGDRHISGGKSDNCESVCPRPGVSALQLRPANKSITWSSAIHGWQGHIAVSDGSVQKTKRRGLQDMVSVAYKALTSGIIRTPNGTKPDNHIRKPR
jgi:type II secretory pathway pseudopilin PulG